MVVDEHLDDQMALAPSPYPPTPQQSLFFYIADTIQMKRDGEDSFQRQARTVIVGPQVRRVNLVVGKHHKAVRVGFHPGGLYRLLGVPMHELVDEGLDAALVWPSDMSRIEEQLAGAPDHQSIKIIIENFLLGKLVTTKALQPFDLAMQSLVRSEGMIDIETLARDSCLSLRQFERVCKIRLGLRPKVFSRITRFSKAYRLSEASTNVNWTSIAYECGYFDQMHLIRDFREFAGVNPGIIENEILAAPLRLQKDLRL